MNKKDLIVKTHTKNYSDHDDQEIDGLMDHHKDISVMYVNTSDNLLTLIFNVFCSQHCLFFPACDWEYIELIRLFIDCYWIFFWWYACFLWIIFFNIIRFKFKTNFVYNKYENYEIFTLNTFEVMNCQNGISKIDKLYFDSWRLCHVDGDVWPLTP